MTRKIIITSDPGQDQAAAIFLFLGRRDAFEVLGIVATAGNIDMSHTEKNCRKLLELADRRDIPVCIGCTRPMRRELVMAAHVHGPTGLDGPVLPEPSMALSPRHGVDFIIDTVRNAPPKTITICSLSPLTNLAMALVKAPDIAARIEEVVMMAGAYFEGGNISVAAEFNVFVDPEAADVVLLSGMKITMLPLDVTHQMLSTRERLAAMRATGTACGIATAAMLEFSEAFDLKKYGWNGAPLHAPCVPVFMLRPDSFSGRDINVSVELSGQLTLGMTVADWWRITDRPRNVFYVRDGDPQIFYDCLNHALAGLP